MPDTVLRFVDPIDQARDVWVEEGLKLGEREQSAKSLMWDIGDWWNRGEPYGDRAQIVTAGGWKGPKHGTCRVAATVATKFNVLKRFNTLEFWHHQIVASLPDDQATELLEWAAEDPEERSANDLRARVKQLKRDTKEATLAAKQRALPEKRYGVIYADPPWRFEPYSRDTGMDRAADNHYPTMTRDAMLDMEVMRTAPAKDCVLFCWATAPMLQEALEWMAQYGFEYKSHCVWVKNNKGTGYWFRNQHELLLIGVKGDIPAPAPGTQYSSVIYAPLGVHSAKPPAFADMIEDLFPNLPALELFARGPRLGWDTWGNEAPGASEAVNG